MWLTAASGEPHELWVPMQVGELSAADERKMLSLQRAAERELLQAADVVCTTATGAGDPRLSNFRFRKVRFCLFSASARYISAILLQCNWSDACLLEWTHPIFRPLRHGGVRTRICQHLTLTLSALAVASQYHASAIAGLAVPD